MSRSMVPDYYVSVGPSSVKGGYIEDKTKDVTSPKVYTTRVLGQSEFVITPRVSRNKYT